VSHHSPWPALDEQAASLLVISRYRVAPVAREDFVERARAALATLAQQPGFVCASIGQATDEQDLFCLRTEWDGVGAYRRALSNFDVKLTAVPLLSTAVDESSAFEVVRHWTIDGETAAPSGLAADSGEVGLGRAAGPHVPPVSS
jgi:hypothetical protein